MSLINSRFRRLFEDLKRASLISERSLHSLLREILALRVGQGKLGISEYFDFRLYEDDLSESEKAMFLGRRGQEILYEMACDEFSTFLGYDKLSQYLILTRLNLPMPELKALYAPHTHRACPVQVIRSEDQWSSFLAKNESYPLYLKPCHGNYGRGNAGIKSFRNGELETTRGETLSLTSFVERLSDHSGLGWLVQSTLRPHPKIREVCGDQISGLRIYTVQTENGPVVHRAVWKINVGGRISDNFEHGASGNMLGAVDLDSGVVTRVVTKVGFDQQVNPLHPVTGAELVGFILPGWDLVKTLALQATGAFPGLIAQGWDIALSDVGPVLLEVNLGGDVDLSQHVHRRGFLDRDYQRHLEELGVAHLLRGPSLKWRSYHGGARRGRRAQHWKWW